MRHLHLTDRLRGQYHLPVNDGAGPLDGSYTFSRSFDTDELQSRAADMIDQFETETPPKADDVKSLIAELETPQPFFGLDPYVKPINQEAANLLRELLTK